jgi:hypothetical protein
MWVIPPTPQSHDIILALDVELSGHEEAYECHSHEYTADSIVMHIIVLHTSIMFPQ